LEIFYIMTTTPTYLVSDIHGQYSKLVNILSEAKLVSEDLDWTAGQTHLWFLGDYFDRGPHGLACLNLIMSLQKQARAAGGVVEALLGNHDVLLLGALFFGEQPSFGVGGTFYHDWLHNGGVESDLDGLSIEQITWLLDLPAMGKVGGSLLAHADARFYLRYGHSVEQVNRGISSLLHERDAEAWDGLLGDFNQRRYFWDPENGVVNVRTFLEIYGAQQFLHGHSPISRLTGQRPDLVTEALVYAEGLCVNLDGGMYLGGPGLLYHII